MVLLMGRLCQREKGYTLARWEPPACLPALKGLQEPLVQVVEGAVCRKGNKFNDFKGGGYQINAFLVRICTLAAPLGGGTAFRDVELPIIPF